MYPLKIPPFIFGKNGTLPLLFGNSNNVGGTYLFWMGNWKNQKNYKIKKSTNICKTGPLSSRSAAYLNIQFVIFKLLSYCFQETTGFDVKASFASRPVSRLIRWYNKPGDITKEFWGKAIQFHGTFHGLKITNCITQPVFTCSMLPIETLEQVTMLKISTLNTFMQGPLTHP